MKEYICLIGRFGNLGCNGTRFLSELRLFLSDDVFPWINKKLLFNPACSDMPYIFDENMIRIAKGYEDCGNRVGFLSLIEASYNFDTFSSEDGLYGKIVLHIPRQFSNSQLKQITAKTFYALEKHIYLEEGQKIKIDLMSNESLENAGTSFLNQKVWMKANIERKGKITQHIFFGNKGDSRKVHIFRRVNESLTYENTSAHYPAKAIPFLKMVQVAVKNGVTHNFCVSPDEIKPDKDIVSKEDSKHDSGGHDT